MQSNDTTRNEQRQADRLLPCPFCQSTESDVVQFHSTLHVECLTCGSEGPPAMTPDLAIAAWNQREPGIVNRNPSIGTDRIAAIESRLKKWFAAKFPDGASLLGFIEKFNEEVIEFCSACEDLMLHDGSNPEQYSKPLAEEAADIVIVLANAVREVCGLSLFDAVEKKLAVIERRLVDDAAGRGK